MTSGHEQNGKFTLIVSWITPTFAYIHPFKNVLHPFYHMEIQVMR